MNDAGIPTMTSAEVRDYITGLGRNWSGAGAAVECGCWLGGTTAALLKGLREVGFDRRYYCYDCWRASPEEVEKAWESGLEIRVGQNLQPVFESFVRPLFDKLIMQRGWIQEALYPGGPIEIFLLDGAKRDPHFSRTLEIFGPHWIPGLTVVGLMDYHYCRKIPEYCDQRRYVEAHSASFALLKDFDDRNSDAFFRYEGGIW